MNKREKGKRKITEASLFFRRIQILIEMKLDSYFHISIVLVAFFELKPTGIFRCRYCHQFFSIDAPRNLDINIECTDTQIECPLDSAEIASDTSTIRYFK